MLFRSRPNVGALSLPMKPGVPTYILNIYIEYIYIYIYYIYYILYNVFRKSTGTDVAFALAFPFQAQSDPAVGPVVPVVPVVPSSAPPSGAILLQTWPSAILRSSLERVGSRHSSDRLVSGGVGRYDLATT